MKMPNLLLPNLPTNSGLSSTRQWRGSWWYRSIWKKRSHSGVIAELHRRENLLKDWKIKRWLIGLEQISVPDIRAVLHKIKTILLWGETKIPQGEGLAGREVCGRNVLFFNPVFNRNSFYSIEMLCIIRYHNHIIDNWRASNYQIKIHDTQTTLSESESFFCIKWNMR